MKKYYVHLFSTLTVMLLTGGCLNKTDKPETPKETMEITKETAIITPSGLKYIVLQEAADDAQHAQNGRHVSVHYTGWLDENGQPGKKFDSSVDRGTPFTFVLGGGMVIRGWDEGVKGMKVGEKRRLIIPADLGYGSRGAGGVIPPNATLIFDVQLLEIK